MDHNNKRQREVFGFSDEDIENEERSERMWLTAAIVLAVLAIGYFGGHWVYYLMTH